MKATYASVDDYIYSFPEGIREIVEENRRTIAENAPDASEGISYGMPAYTLKGKPLVYFAAFAKHIGFYATPSGHAQFSEKLSKYKQGKGSVQFPLNQAIPLELITEIVRFRVKENETHS